MTDKKEECRHHEPTASRPRIPAGYSINPLDTAGTIAWSKVGGRLAKERNYWVATTRPDGRPHAMPVWGLWLDEMFYFATDPASRKGRNLAANSNVAVHLKSGDDLVVLEGGVEEVMEPPLLQHFAEDYPMKYQIRLDVNSRNSKVYRLRPKVAFAWQEKDFPTTATRWSFDYD